MLPNIFIVRDVDPDNAKDFLFSANMYRIAKANGWWKEGEALAIPAAGAGRRRSVVIPVAGKLRTDGQAATAVLASSGAVSKAAAAAGPRQGSNTGEAIGRSVAAQTLALRQLADKGRDDLVPNARRRMSDEDSFDDDL